MHETGSSLLVHWDDPEGRDGEGDGGRVRMGNTCTSMADSCECMAKTTTVLINKKEKKEFSNVTA